MPVDADGGVTGAAATVSTARLEAGYSSAYFYSAPDDAMVFYAPSNGATTTPGVGSDHARSELRELYDPDAGITEWSSQIGGTMNAVCQVDVTSVDSDEATIGQIHGLSSAFVLLQYDPVGLQVKLAIYPTPTSTSSQHTVIASNINLGDLITYQLQLSGSNLNVTVGSDGGTQSFAIDPSWSGLPVYFKAGAYSSAPNSGNPPGDATQVSFHQLSVSHP